MTKPVARVLIHLKTSVRVEPAAITRAAAIGFASADSSAALSAAASWLQYGRPAPGVLRRSMNGRLVALEILDRTLVLFCGGARRKCPQVPALPGLQVLLARVQPEFPRRQFAYHDGLRRRFAGRYSNNPAPSTRTSIRDGGVDIDQAVISGSATFDCVQWLAAASIGVAVPQRLCLPKRFASHFEPVPSKAEHSHRQIEKNKTDRILSGRRRRVGANPDAQLHGPVLRLRPGPPNELPYQRSRAA